MRLQQAELQHAIADYDAHRFGWAHQLKAMVPFARGLKLPAPPRKQGGGAGKREREAEAAKAAEAAAFGYDDAVHIPIGSRNCETREI